MNSSTQAAKYDLRRVNYALFGLLSLSFLVFFYFTFEWSNEANSVIATVVNSMFFITSLIGSCLIYIDFILREYKKYSYLLIGVLLCCSFIVSLKLLSFSSVVILIWFIGLAHLFFLALFSMNSKVQIINHLFMYLLLPSFVGLSNLSLVLIGKNSPIVQDELFMAIDGTLGIYPSLIMGRLNEALPPLLFQVVNALYLSFPLVFVIIYKIRLSIEKNPPIDFILEAIFIGIIGYLLYYVIPGCGSRFIFQSTWPYSVPNRFLLEGPQLVQCPIDVPRGCIPSLHTAWLICLIRNAFLCKRWTKILMVSFSTGVIIAIFGIGAHYLVDVIVGFLFANALGGLFAFKIPYNHPARWQAMILGTIFCLGWYYLILFGLSWLQWSRILAWSVFLGSVILSLSLEYKLIKALNGNKHPS